MKHFNMMENASGWSGVYKTLSAESGKVETEKIFSEAKKIEADYLKKTEGGKGINKMHVTAAISMGALYLPLKDAVGKEKAIEMLTEGAKPAAVAKNKRLGKMPAKMFIKVAGVITSVMFGEKAGFKRRWISNSKTEKRFDLLTCPYVETLKKMGCPEVCPAICVQDEYSFKGLKNGVAFERTKTLGNGNDCCDFWYKIESKYKYTNIVK